MFHTRDTPGIRLASPGAVPIEMTHFVATVIDVELALRARRRALATTRADPDFFMRINPLVLNVADGNFSIFIIYADIAGQDAPWQSEEKQETHHPCKIFPMGDGRS
jgi:hypothetical protein